MKNSNMAAEAAGPAGTFLDEAACSGRVSTARADASMSQKAHKDLWRDAAATVDLTTSIGSTVAVT